MVLTVIEAGSWVQIDLIVLPPGKRAPGVPPDTAALPLQARVKGFLAAAASMPGETVTVRTLSGRSATGRLIVVNPGYSHGFGDPVPELLEVGPEERERLRTNAGI